MPNSVALVDELSALASSLENLDLSSSFFEEPSRETRDRLVRTLRSYLIPRLEDGAGPLTIVFAGPTGSGKSTLVNSLSRIKVSETGPIRPTTKAPVALSAEASAASYVTIGGVDCEVIIGKARILERMTLIDTPDIDSTETEHRVMAETLIDHADVVVFVTSALRYADLVPWQVLRRAVSRGTPVIHVLNRVTGETSAAVTDFRRRLTEARFHDELMRVPEHNVGVGAHSIPALAVTGLRRRLAAIAEDRDRYQQEVLDRVLMASLDQATDMAAEVESAAVLAEIAESEVLSVFEGGAETIELGPLVEPLALRPPPDRGWLKRWRWLKESRQVAAEDSDFWGRVGRRISASVESDIGGRGMALPLLAEVAPTLGRHSRTVIEAAFEGWVESLGARVGQVADRNRQLAAMVLGSAALGGANRDAARALFGIESDPLAGSAQADLRSRLEVVYTHASNIAAEAVRAGEGAPTAGDLSDRLASVVVASHFADA